MTRVGLPTGETWLVWKEKMMSGNGTSAPILLQSDGHATPSSCLTPQISAFNWFSILLLDLSWSSRSKIYTRGKLVATFNQRLRLRHQRAVIATFQLQYWPGPQLGASSSIFYIVNNMLGLGWLCGLKGNRVYTFHPKTAKFNIQLHLISANVIWKIYLLHQLSTWNRQSFKFCFFYKTKSRGVQLRSILSVWSLNHKAFQISKSWYEYSRLFFETWWWRFASKVDIGFWHLLDLLPPLP